jgi:N utilization substance protein A
MATCFRFSALNNQAAHPTFVSHCGGGMKKKKQASDERSPELQQDNEAQLDDLGSDPGQVGPDSAGQSGDPQGLSEIADMNEESVEELADTDQAFEAAAVEGVEDAADHPERPTHTHDEYGADDFPEREEDEAA